MKKLIYLALLTSLPLCAQWVDFQYEGSNATFHAQFPNTPTSGGGAVNFLTRCNAQDSIYVIQCIPDANSALHVIDDKIAKFQNSNRFTFEHTEVDGIRTLTYQHINSEEPKAANPDVIPLSNYAGKIIEGYSAVYYINFYCTSYDTFTSAESEADRNQFFNSIQIVGN